MNHESDNWNTVYHDTFEKALQAIMKCHSTYGSRTPRSLRIVGHLGTGKTWLIEEVLRRLPTSEGDEGARIRALRIEIPSPPTIKTLLVEILKAMNDPAPTTGTLAQMEFRVMTLLRKAGVEILLVDEVQHFVSRGSMVPVGLTSNMFKTLINKTRLPVVLFGTPSCRRLFRVNGQLRSRIPQELVLRAFRWDKTADVLAFLGIAKRQFPLGFSNDDYLFDEEVAERLWFATYGILRPLSYLLKELREMAGEHGVLNDAVLSEAFRQRIWSEAPNHRNPFHKAFDWQPLVFENEPYQPEAEEGDAHEGDGMGRFRADDGDRSGQTARSQIESDSSVHQPA